MNVTKRLNDLGPEPLARQDHASRVNQRHTRALGRGAVVNGAHLEYHYVDEAVPLPVLSTALARIAGSPPVFDLVHPGLGADGHAGSLVFGDPALDVNNTDITATAVYQRRCRLTLTYPTINRSRRVVWVVSGSAKASMLMRLLAGDRSNPAGRVHRKRALVIADHAAAEKLARN